MVRIKWPEMVGKEYNGFAILDVKREPFGDSGRFRTEIYVRCPVCQQEKWMRADALKKASSCGCTKYELKVHCIGQRFNRLVVKERVVKNGIAYYKCECDCGNVIFSEYKNLRDGRTKSCGCYKKERHSEQGKKIGDNTKKFAYNNTQLKTIQPGRILSNNTSGVTGVSWDKSRGMWVAQMEFQGKSIYIGRFKNKEDAIEARKEAEKKYFGAFLDQVKQYDPEIYSEAAKKNSLREQPLHTWKQSNVTDMVKRMRKFQRPVYLHLGSGEDAKAILSFSNSCEGCIAWGYTEKVGEERFFYEYKDDTEIQVSEKTFKADLLEYVKKKYWKGETNEKT